MRNGITIKDLDELAALIRKLEQHSALLGEANQKMKADILAAESWFQGSNYNTFREQWLASSTVTERSLAQVPEIIAYLNRVHNTAAILVSLK